MAFFTAPYLLCDEVLINFYEPQANLQLTLKITSDWKI